MAVSVDVLLLDLASDWERLLDHCCVEENESSRLTLLLTNPAVAVPVSVNFIPSVKEYEKDFDFVVVAVEESSQLTDREMDWEPPMATLSQLRT